MSTHATPLSIRIPYAIDPKPMSGLFTPFAGLAAVSAIVRGLGISALCEQYLSIKIRDRGLTPAQIVESLILLHAAGGESMTDITRLRDDQAIGKMLGFQPPSARCLGDFLERFHDPETIVSAKEEAFRNDRLAFIPEETDPLKRLFAVQQGLVKTIASHIQSMTVATVDQDATIIESGKKEASWTYEGVKGFQPMVAAWAETGLILSDEFRDGNVPALLSPLTCARAAFKALPEDITERYFRGDSACHEHKLIDWLRDDARTDGPSGFIGFAISARMSVDLKTSLLAVPEKEWHTFDKEDDGTLRQWAELDFVPNEPSEHKQSEPLRYIGLRLKKPQPSLFADGSDCHYHAIISNRWDYDGGRLLQWHREKAGTIEHIHDDLKNGIGGGRLPSGKFGANAAWFRIACIAYNTLVALRTLWPDEKLRNAKPKRLRYEIIVAAGRLTRDRRKVSLRIAQSVSWIRKLIDFFASLPVIIRSTG